MIVSLHTVSAARLGGDSYCNLRKVAHWKVFSSSETSLSTAESSCNHQVVINNDHQMIVEMLFLGPAQST